MVFLIICPVTRPVFNRICQKEHLTTGGSSHRLHGTILQIGSLEHTLTFATVKEIRLARSSGPYLGDVTVNFTIGEYDYPTKKDLMGGDVINTDKGWKRARGKVNIEKLLVALTDDDQYCVIPRADIGAREATTDKAVGIPVSAVELEPQNAEVAPEYWFDSSEVKAGA